MDKTKKIIKQVKKIEIKTRQLVDGLIAGNYHSVFKGEGIEFSEIREYKPGDDIRSIDWKVTARLNEPFVKEFIEERLTITNMAIEAGGKNAIMEADEKVLEWLKDKTKKPLRMIKADPDARYCCEYEFDASKIEPVVAAPNLPSNVKPVSEVAGTPINQVFIGSCTNGRITDLRIAAQILKGRKVHPDVRCIVIPASDRTYKQALKEGLIDILAEAGCLISTSTCGPCLGGHMGILAEGEVCVSTSNRNFTGRMGHPNSQVYLAGPAVAAASAVLGRIAHPEEVVGTKEEEPVLK